MSAPLDPTVAATGTLPPQAVVDGLQIFKTLGPSAAATVGDAGEDAGVDSVGVSRGDQRRRRDARHRLERPRRPRAPHPERVVPELLALVVPALEDAGEADAAAAKRRGAAAVAAALVESMGATLAAYCVLLLVPLMGRMSDPVQGTRETATRSFAALVPLLPLARGAAPPPGLSDSQRERSARDGAFLEALLDNSKVQDFELPFACKRTLRPYQQEGVNWLAFLRRFKLHGALCDDMGLGKTLQSTCILAATVVERRAAGSPRLPALVVCPPTLVGHWAHEINQYVDEDVLRPLQYQGTPHERAAIRPLIASGKYDVVITSYDSLRSDADELLEGKSWCYCILDEGHAIRNPKARITRAVKRVRAEHRLLLSGTPIQNDVVELWSLFDFLMPGFLGTEREFRSTYGIAGERSVAAKKGGGLTEQGALATGRLHKQVMPFVMRRTKDEVLKDLPPKIIQDVYCDLSPYQRRLYDAFEGSSVKSDVDAAVRGGGDAASGATTHVFQALQYPRKLWVPAIGHHAGGEEERGVRAQTQEAYSPKFLASSRFCSTAASGRTRRRRWTSRAAAEPAVGGRAPRAHLLPAGPCSTWWKRRCSAACSAACLGFDSTGRWRRRRGSTSCENSTPIRPSTSSSSPRTWAGWGSTSPPPIPSCSWSTTGTRRRICRRWTARIDSDRNAR